MMRSMFAGVSGMKSHQTMMDVVGDNIANINTSGFKGSRVLFQDTLSQVARGGGASTDTQGSINPSQVGLGVKVTSIDAAITQGALQTTGRPSDLAIQGNGYFSVSVDNGTRTAYTRSGAFAVDGSNHLVDPAGGILQGYQADADGSFPQDFAQNPGPPASSIVIPRTKPGDTATPPAALRSFSVAADGVVNAVYSDGEAVAVARVALTTFDNPAGLLKGGEGRLFADVASGEPQTNGAGAGGSGSLAAGALEMSNVDLAQEFTSMIIAQRGFQANSKVISTSDELLQELVNLKR